MQLKIRFHLLMTFTSISILVILRSYEVPTEQTVYCTRAVTIIFESPILNLATIFMFKKNSTNVLYQLIPFEWSNLNLPLTLYISLQVVLTTEESKAELANVCKELEKISQTFSMSTLNEEVTRQLQSISEKLQMSDSDASRQNVEASFSRLEKQVNSLLQKVELAEQSKEPRESIFNSDFEKNYPYLYSYKDDVSYALISCFSVYCLYRLFFP